MTAYVKRKPSSSAPKDKLPLSTASLLREAKADLEQAERDDFAGRLAIGECENALHMARQRYARRRLEYAEAYKAYRLARAEAAAERHRERAAGRRILRQKGRTAR